MKKICLMLPIVILLLLSSCTDKPDAWDIIIKVNEKYKNMEDFKAIKIVKNQGYIITSIKEIEIKKNKYKIIEDDEIEVSDGTNVWSYNVYGPEPPKLHFPENNSDLDLSSLDFIWDRQRNNKYVFQIDENKEFSSLYLPDLEDNKKYYWRVYPVDVNGKFNESTAEIREFRVKDNMKYEFDSSDFLSKFFLSYNKTKSRVYKAFPLGENITDNPIIKAYNSITIETSGSALLASIIEKDGGYVIDKNKINKNLKLEIKDNQLLQEIKEMKTDENRIIIDETVNPVDEYVDEVQIMGDILDIYVRNFQVKSVSDNFYVVEGKEAKEKLKSSLSWSKIKAWINKDDYSVWKIEFYGKVDKRDILFLTVIYEDMSFDNNLSDEEFMLVKE